jgi:hypothetical protein
MGDVNANSVGTRNIFGAGEATAVIVPAPVGGIVQSLNIGEAPDTGGGVLIWGVVQMLPGSGTATSVNVRVRTPAGVTGTVLATYSQPVTASTPVAIPFSAIDPTQSGPVSYKVTLEMVGAAGGDTNVLTGAVASIVPIVIPSVQRS